MLRNRRSGILQENMALNWYCSRLTNRLEISRKIKVFPVPGHAVALCAYTGPLARPVQMNFLTPMASAQTLEYIVQGH